MMKLIGTGLMVKHGMRRQKKMNLGRNTTKAYQKKKKNKNQLRIGTRSELTYPNIFI